MTDDIYLPDSVGDRLCDQQQAIKACEHALDGGRPCGPVVAR
jgi:hypothetical protein